MRPRTLTIALADLTEWYILQADFVSAYLAGDLKETIFMEQFPHLQEYFAAHKDVAKRLGYTKDKVVELKKPLYGLEQSGAYWQDKVKSIMRGRGPSPLNYDNVIYQKQNSEIIVASYVDDFLLIGPKQKDLQDLTKSLNDEVPLNYSGEAG